MAARRALVERLRVALVDRRFAADIAAVGAVEFALVAPLLLILYMGGSEAAVAVTINRKVQHTANTVNDLIAQTTSLTPDQVEGIFNISSAVMQPYDTDELRIKVTSVYIDATGKASAVWSCSRGMTKDHQGDTITLPSQFATSTDSYLMVAETRYGYTPLGGYGLQTPFDMGETSYLHPRIGTSVSCTDCAPPQSCTDAS
ncbi:TadE/TadG family type IV pilus assembly protein [Consotaella aegiceratis]|uniref:TadE/TadG family type IV pilus assembly protein n=1 Tax=Consotaella aegiceratis TaxID=3097961 RepID=UPI002F411394